MKASRPLSVALVLALSGLTNAACAADPEIPFWAFVVDPPGLARAADDGASLYVPGSNTAFTLTQIRNLFAVPDWHPGDHPAMPDIVAQGRKPAVFACAYCHLPNGLGRPENASLAGLPAEYIVQQVKDFQSGARHSSEPRSLPVNLMVSLAKAVSDEELRIAADYFASLEPTPWLRVIEADVVPKTEALGWMLASTKDGGSENIGQRIVEMPMDLERTELRDARSGFIAYAPTGSIAKGKSLATASAITPCTACHGQGLKGLGPVPALAGRSPSYLFRQLYDIRHGTRNGNWSALMKPVVAKLSEDDMLALSAYAASLEP